MIPIETITQKWLDEWLEEKERLDRWGQEDGGEAEDDENPMSGSLSTLTRLLPIRRTAAPYATFASPLKAIPAPRATAGLGC